MTVVVFVSSTSVVGAVPAACNTCTARRLTSSSTCKGTVQPLRATSKAKGMDQEQFRQERALTDVMYKESVKQLPGHDTYLGPYSTCNLLRALGTNYSFNHVHATLHDMTMTGN
jgi:hypothetical protein